MPRPAAAVARLRGDERGTVAVMAACSFGVVFAMAALGVDASRFYLLRRQQQSATDLAAIAASSSIGSAGAAARASLAANGRSAADLVSVEVGTYVPDPAIASGLRFTPGAGTGVNAARVTLRTVNPSFFGPVLSALMAPAKAATLSEGGPAGAVITTQAVAALQNSAAFALGSRLAALDNGLLNQLLGQMLGTKLSLSVMDYQALASTDVDLFGFADALALRVAPKGATYGSLAALPVRLSDVLWAAADAASRTSSGAAGVLRAMAAAAGPSSPKLLLGGLVSYGPFGNVAVGSSAPIAAAVPVLPLVAAAAKLGGGTSEVVADVALNAPGIASGTVKLVVGALPTDATYAAVGPSGTVLRTAQTGLLLTLRITAAAPLASLSLPLIVEVAPATARLASVSCSGGPSAVVAVRPGVVDAWVGTASDTDFAAGRVADPAPGPLVTGALGLQLTGLAHVTIANTSESLVAFSPSDIAGGVAKTTTTVDFAAPLLSGLFGSLQLRAQVAGLQVAVPPALSGAVATALQQQLQPIDGVLASTLALLGLSVGDADTWVRGVRCGQAALVD